MKSYFGYLMAGIGLIGLAMSSPFGKKFLPFMEKVNQESVLIGSLCFVIAGVLVISIFGKSRHGVKGKHIEKEVPIYRGKKIVGYRMED